MNYYIGLSLASSSGMDSGVAVIDEDNNLITLDKLYKMNDVIYFFENFTSLKNSKICASVPYDRTMLEGKWRILAKPYLPVATNKNIPNRDNWTQRHSSRGSDYFRELYKDRSPQDCKFLQQALRNEWGFNELPSNMMPMSHMEAILGAILAKENEIHPEKIRTLYEFKGLNVIDINQNIKISTDIYKFENDMVTTGK